MIRRPPISTPFPYTTLFRSKLAFVIHLRAVARRRQNDRFAGILQGIDSFRENNGVFRNLKAGLRGVRPVVLPDAPNAARFDRREPFRGSNRFPRQPETARHISFHAPPRTVRLLRRLDRPSRNVSKSYDFHYRLQLLLS